MQFEFATAARIIFGEGKFNQVGRLAAGFGQRALVVGGASPDRLKPLLGLLAEAGVETVPFSVRGEPTVSAVRQGVNLARSENCSVVVGLGGGSALDCGKAIAAMATNSGDILEYLEVIGAGKTLTQPSLPFIVIPTTAGTGTEVTRNAVIGSPEHGVKVSLRSPLMLPRLALIDPLLTHTLPPLETATSGMDALTQLIEPYVCNRPNPIVDAICKDGIRLAARALRKVYQHPDDALTRREMSLAALYGGLALANAGLGAVHGFAGPIGGMRPAAHGAVCACLLPIVMEANIRALIDRAPESEALRRNQEIARFVTGDDQAETEDGVAWVYQLRDDLHIPGLRAYGFSEADVPALVEKSAKASSMAANPVRLSTEEMTEILLKAL